MRTGCRMPDMAVSIGTLQDSQGTATWSVDCDQSTSMLMVRTRYSDEERDDVFRFYADDGWQLLHHDAARNIYTFTKRAHAYGV